MGTSHATTKGDSRASDGDLAGRTALVTGATSGIGYETALALARRGAHVIIGTRSEARGGPILEKLRRESGSSEISLFVADLEVMEQVRAAARQLADRTDRLDILVCNAGLWTWLKKTTVDGFERSIAITHLAHALLTLEVLPLLRAAPAARVVNVSSLAHWGGFPDWDELRYIPPLDPGASYCTSKLAQVLWTFALARRLSGSSVMVNAVLPGLVGSGLYRRFPPPLNLLYKIVFAAFFNTPQQGARTQLWAATGAELEGVSGQYLSGGKISRASPIALDENEQEAAYKKTLGALRMEDPFAGVAAASARA